MIYICTSRRPIKLAEKEIQKDSIIKVKKTDSNSYEEIGATEILVDEKFSSIVIMLHTKSGEVRKYFLRKTKRDKLVLI